jgi:pimeloyl-ACP methyl ester carboxylesterase
VSAGRLAPAELQAALAAPAPADGFTSCGYRVDGLNVHVRERPGDAAELACLLLHGLAVSHRYLMPTARQLDRRRVLVPDLPGFGLSAKPTRVYAVDDHAALLARWLDSIGLPQVCVLGNSFGCQIGVALAVRRPDLVPVLVLVGPTVDPAAASMAGQVVRWVRDALHEDKRQVAILTADVRDAGVRRIVATLRYSVRDRIEHKLPLVRARTLVVRGERDRVVPQRWLIHAATLIPNARPLVIPRAAHNAVTTAGPHLASAVEEFLAEVRGQR